MTGYTRNDTANNIASGKIADAADIDGEFDAIVAAFHASTGHTHDGTTAEGAPITVIGPAQDFVAGASDLKPKTDSAYTLGTIGNRWSNVYSDAVDVGGNIVVSGTVDGRDVATDGTKLDTIETNADVTDTANVTAAGALMDSEVTNLSGIKTLTVPDNTTISTFGASLVDDTTAAAARTTLGLGTMAVETATNYAQLNSPAFTGNPTAPTQTAGDNSTKIATTAYVDASASSLAFISSATATSAASVDFTSNIDSTYDYYIFILDGVYPVNVNDDLRVRTTNGGGFDSGSSDYSYRSRYWFGTSSTGDLGSTGNSYIRLAEALSSTASDALFGEVKLWNPAKTSTQTFLSSDVVYESAGGTKVRLSGVGVRQEVSNVTGIQFYASTGNITGTIHMYGVKS